MKKLLIIYNYLLHYRKPLFNEISKYYEVTIIHSGEKTVKSMDMYSEIIVPVKFLGPFYFQIGLLKEVRNSKYDIIIALFDIRWISTMLSIFVCKQTTKFIWWGAWITKSELANKLRIMLSKKADANIFYTFSSMSDFIKRGIDKKSLFVANNTIDVGSRIKAFENNNKTKILFVGSLDKRKQIDILIKAFSNILDRIPKNIQLTIIGHGVEYNKLIELVNYLQLNHRVIFLGRINDPKELKKYYTESFLSVSFGQAGLSVLQAFGFGVPFLTKKNAISGGEITNIKHMFNGILCEDNLNSLEENLIFAVNHLKQMLLMGENAYNYYSEYCTIENYAVGFKDAIEGTRNAKVDSSNP